MEPLRIVRISSILLVFLIYPTYGQDVPQLINYQGYMMQDGAPFSGDASMAFAIYDAATEGNELWSETHPMVTVTGGYYSVLLGSATPFSESVFGGPERYLEIEFQGETMESRIRIASVGFALNADKIDGQDAAEFLSTSSDYGRTGVATDLYEGTAKLSDKYVEEEQPGSITSDMITSLAVTEEKIALDAVNSAKIQDGTIVDSDISSSAAIAQSKISNVSPAIDADKLDGLDASDFAQAPVFTRLQYQLSDTETTVGWGYAELRVVGDFTKVSDDTDIELTWIGHGSVVGSFCEFQLRIDGVKDNGNSDTNFEGTSGGSAILYAAEAPIAVTALFQDLSSGLHTVSIWVRGSATSCTCNPGNFGQTVLVREIYQQEGITVGKRTMSGTDNADMYGGFPKQ